MTLRERQFTLPSVAVQKEIILQREILLREFKTSFLRINGTTKPYSHQEEFSDKIINLLKEKKILFLMIIAKTQSGKTGIISSIINEYYKRIPSLINDKSSNFPYTQAQDIYVITGLSSVSWKSQTQERLPRDIKVYHRNDLIKLANQIKNRKNILIIIDEVHIASKQDQTLYLFFKEAGILSKQEMFIRNISVIELTATPFTTLSDLMSWNGSARVLFAGHGEGYTGILNLLLTNRVKQAQDITKDTENTKCVKEYLTQLETDIQSFPTPRYHIIRTPTGAKQVEFVNVLKKEFKYSYNIIYYDSESMESKISKKKNDNTRDINKILEKRPKKHTLIFIKEMIRCSKTLEKNNVGILYERMPRKPNNTVIIQGLLGRSTGYDDIGDSIIYTDIEAIHYHEKLWKSRFMGDLDFKKIHWKEKEMTFNNPSLYSDNSHMIDKECPICCETRSHHMSCFSCENLICIKCYEKIAKINRKCPFCARQMVFQK